MDLSSLLSSLSINDTTEGNVITFGAEVSGVHTDFVLGLFTNKQIIVVSQYKKLGGLFKVYIDQPGNGLNISEPVYTVKTVFGASNIQAEATARYIAEKLHITKPLTIFLDLKDFSKRTVHCVVEAILNYPKA